MWRFPFRSSAHRAVGGASSLVATSALLGAVMVVSYGSLDIVFTPNGAADGYRDLSADSVDIGLADQTVAVISVATWVRLKEASGRLRT